MSNIAITGLSHPKTVRSVEYSKILFNLATRLNKFRTRRDACCLKQLQHLGIFQVLASTSVVFLVSNATSPDVMLSKFSGTYSCPYTKGINEANK